ncbi:S-adenosyl-L-methionine-dependent tRNA 4-demethylwyosine synthase-like protein [Leptotrombidium deliense]|uniref:S-adenosyl-L-methionine-dependent tRNA 4-demethylwyosine synthase TYW1 n=1 Tax=Leptotrombidium deliense TaxID=299467 RepID=A0A443SB01_9ACAR|nr:S-adenosyl-L-methionine-dependent tRNA 4-demethylwyosine synthase-like protein [Leptotrombidium deliense]
MLRKAFAAISNLINNDYNKADDLASNRYDLTVVYCTQTGNAKKIAEQFVDNLETTEVSNIRLLNVKELDAEDYFSTISQSDIKSNLLIITSTYVDGDCPEDAKWFCKWLKEAADDFRVDKEFLRNLNFAIFGLGNSEYKDNYCLIAKNLEKWLLKLGATKISETGFADECMASSLSDQFNGWKSKIVLYVSTGTIDSSVIQTNNEIEDEGSSSDEENNEDIVDIEDILSEKRNNEKSIANGNKQMITPKLREELTKQGYKLIGSHSGVKMCRWTKSMLRGRGGCYKHTFYGIESHRCMEATPSLACANKCVFCWRHHTNPVGTEWKWEMDSPEMIVEEAIKNHCKMINEFKGVPGVILDRFNEGLQIKHCALSLVGEPIMYPEINKIIRYLHDKSISTFLVTNAQFPDAIRNLVPVTQLYVSVDASSKESLKKIDRPLFKDFWQRFLDSLKALSDKRQRTVYRLTLVKSWNNEEIEGYSKLISIGKPDFVEVKGVTYCGTGKSSNLTMQNVPWHHEVLSFVKKLTEHIQNEYEIASEHEHSNCVLIANKRFKVNGKWRTWIDYDKFHELVRKYYNSNGLEKFEAVDYMCETPNWAVLGSDERGFDPSENRFRRKTKN